MKHAILIFALILPAMLVSAQTKPKTKAKTQTPPSYSTLVTQADSLYRLKDYKNASKTYSRAFKANNWQGTTTERYNAASAWALSNMPDSAFANLNSLTAQGMDYSDYSTIATDASFKSLRGDKRWQPLMETVRQNRDRATAGRFNQSLATELDNIYQEDQKYRTQLGAIEKQYGWQSKEVTSHRMILRERDSINRAKVTAMLDQYGWMGSDVIGSQGSSTLFWVIQNSDVPTREKYLPMLREAVKNGNASATNLALMEDQLALAQGRRQIYGTQIGRNPDTQTYYILPLDDPDNVDKRRAELGLPPMSNYVTRWKINWDPVQYKQDLPGIEEREKTKNN